MAAVPAPAQIGGHTAADGPFLLEDAEDLNLTAGGVQRDWVPDRVQGVSNPLQAVSVASTGLTPTSGQSPLGTLRFTMTTRFGYISYGFGVPVPSQPGQSTLTHPGNMTSFSHLTFLLASSINLNDQKKQVILECYPGTGSDFPKLYWNYDLQAGTAFQQVTIDLWNPSHTENHGPLTTADLLSRTRYLYFYFYGGPETGSKTLVVHLDDIRLVGDDSRVDDWALY